MLYADLEVIVQRLPDGSHAVDMRFRAEPGDVDLRLELASPALPSPALAVLTGLTVLSGLPRRPALQSGLR